MTMSVTMRAIELWSASDSQWIQELSSYHPSNLGDARDISHGAGPQSKSEHRSSRELASWVHNAILGYVNRNVAFFRKTVCVGLKYCESIKEGIFEKEGWKLAVALSDSLLMSATGLPVPVLLFSVYVVKNRILDVACNCV